MKKNLIKRKELLKVLEKVKPGIAAKEIVESMTYFLFTGTDIITYNDKISIQHPWKSDFQLFVKASDLYRVLSKLTENNISLQEKDSKLLLNCSTLKANLATIKDEEVNGRITSVGKSLKSAKWKKLPGNFSSCALLCSFTAARQESEGILTCVYTNKNDCIASDNDRVAHAKFDSEIEEMFIKASEIKDLVAINPINYAITKSWLHFKNADGCIFSIRKTEGEFPDYLAFFKFKGAEVTMPQKLLEGLDIASVLADDNDPAVEFKIGKGAVHLRVTGDGGSVHYRAQVNYKGSDILFNTNPNFLKEMMAHSSSIVVGEDKARLQTDDKNFALVTALYN